MRESKGKAKKKAPVLLRGWNFILTVCICLSVITPYHIYSHAHVFIDNSLVFVFDESGLIGVKVTWIFDEMFGTSVIGDYDRNKDGKFSADEVKRLQAGAFSNMKKHDYFCHVRVDGRKFKVHYVKDFTPALVDGKLSYSFFVPLTVRAAKEPHRISFAVYDDTYYCDVVFAEKEKVKIKGLSPGKYSLNIIETPKKTSYVRPIVVEEALLEFRK